MIIDRENCYTAQAGGGIIQSVTANAQSTQVIHHQPPAPKTPSPSQGVPYTLTQGRGIGAGQPIFV